MVKVNLSFALPIDALPVHRSGAEYFLFTQNQMYSVTRKPPVSVTRNRDENPDCASYGRNSQAMKIHDLASSIIHLKLRCTDV
jgi:hypothetical protein